jgi:hypothetical protein
MTSVLSMITVWEMYQVTLYEFQFPILSPKISHKFFEIVIRILNSIAPDYCIIVKLQAQVKLISLIINAIRQNRIQWWFQFVKLARNSLQHRRVDNYGKAWSSLICSGKLQLMVFGVVWFVWLSLLLSLFLLI